MSESNIHPLRIFISYAHSDVVIVRKLCNYLRRKGYIVWLDEKELVAGQEWKIEIEKALLSSDVAIVCLSTNSVKRESFIQREFKFALEKALDMPEGRIFLIPVRLNECEMPYKLSHYQWVDLFSKDGYQKLVKALEIRVNQLGLNSHSKSSTPKNAVSFRASTRKTSRAITQTTPENQDNLNKTIQIIQTRYLDCMDSARFASSTSYQNIRLFKLLYVKAQFILTIISGDIIYITENQLLDSLGFLETFDELYKVSLKSKIRELPLRVALIDKEAGIKKSVARNLIKDTYTLNLWEDLNTAQDRRQKWAHAIEAGKKPAGGKVVFASENHLLDKLWNALRYFDTKRCVSAEQLPHEFANRIEQVVVLSERSLEEMKEQRFHEQLYIHKQSVFTSNEECTAAKEMVKTLRKIRNSFGTRIEGRSKLRTAIKEYPCDQNIKEGLNELVDALYNQVLGIASKANIIQSSSSQEQTNSYIKAGYALAAFIQETSNSHFHNMYVPWEIFEYDGFEGVEKVERRQLDIVVKNVPWTKLLKLGENQLWCQSLLEYKQALSSLQEVDEIISKEENRVSQESLENHYTKQNELRKAWTRHIDNTRKLIPDLYWDITDTKILFFRKEDDGHRLQLPLHISYSHFKTKRDITKDEAYARWQRNLSLKGRMDARMSSATED